MTTPEETASADEISWEAATRLLEGLSALPPAQRAGAIERLVRIPSPGIRERALRLGASLLPEARLVEHVRNDVDATLRNAGLEMLKLRGARSFAIALRLLNDPDEDVALQAILILDHLRDPRALEPLRAVLASSDLNLAQAAIVAIGKLGNARSVPDLLPFLDGDPWLQMAAVQALGDLRSARAVPALAGLFTDLMLSSIAVEAVARIGGLSAYRALAEHWQRHGPQLEADSVLGLLAHVLEGLPRAPADRAGLLASLGSRLGDPFAEGAAAAARCILVLGPSPNDGPAIETLVALASAGSGDGGAIDGGGSQANAIHAAGLVPESLPPALAHRPDLIAALLGRRGPARSWGVLLGAAFPSRLPRDEFKDALADAGRTPGALAAATRCLLRLSPSAASARGFETALLDLYLGLAPEVRPELAPALKRHRRALREALAERRDVDAANRVVLSAELGAKPREVTAGLLALAVEDRLRALAQLADHRQAMRALPWAEWLREAPEIYAAAAAEAAAAGLADLLPLLRGLPPALAQQPMLRAFAQLQDRSAVPVLLAVLRERPDLRPATIEALGRIGGPDARRALAEATRSGATHARLAYRALAMCATEEDEALFRDAVADPDWYIRLACAEVLGRFARAENLGALSRLVGDSVPAVAHRALAALEG